MKNIAHRFRRKGLVKDDSISQTDYTCWIEALSIGGENISKIEDFLSKITALAHSQLPKLETDITTDKQNFGKQLRLLHKV